MQGLSYPSGKDGVSRRSMASPRFLVAAFRLSLPCSVGAGGGVLTGVVAVLLAWFMYACACAMVALRTVGSRQSVLTIFSVSAFEPIVSKTARMRRINCVSRLYQPLT